MSDLIKQYGILVIYGVVGVLTIGILYGAFTGQWKTVGAVPNGQKMNYVNQVRVPKPPILMVEDQVLSVDSVQNAMSFAKAKETTGEDLTKEIQVKEISGNLLQPDLSINTEDSGVCYLEYWVKGRYGDVTKDQICVIVDPR